MGTEQAPEEHGGGFSKASVHCFRKATQSSCHTKTVTAGLSSSQEVSYCHGVSYKTASLEPGQEGSAHHAHTRPCPQQLCFYLEPDVAAREDLDSEHVLGAGNGCL